MIWYESIYSTVIGCLESPCWRESLCVIFLFILFVYVAMYFPLALPSIYLIHSWHIIDHLQKIWFLKIYKKRCQNTWDGVGYSVDFIRQHIFGSQVASGDAVLHVSQIKNRKWGSQPYTCNFITQSEHWGLSRTRTLIITGVYCLSVP